MALSTGRTNRQNQSPEPGAPVVIEVLGHEDEPQVDIGAGDVFVQLQHGLKVWNGVFRPGTVTQMETE